MVVYAVDTNTFSYYLRREGGGVPRLQSLAPNRLALLSVAVLEVR